MSYQPRRMSIIGLIAKLIGWLLGQWKLIALIAFFVSPAGPHLRWEYQYREAYGHRAFISCTYLGSRGFITPDYVEGCPVIAWLDSRP